MVFCSTSKPQLAWQRRACARHAGIQHSHTVDLSALPKAAQPKEVWREETKGLFFCTPAALLKDVKKGPRRVQALSGVWPCRRMVLGLGVCRHHPACDGVVGPCH